MGKYSPKKFQKTKQKMFVPRVYGFDIETFNNNKGFLCAAISNPDGSSKVFYTKKDLIKEFTDEKYRGSYITATNLGFDFLGVFHGSDAMMKFRTLFRGGDLLYATVHTYNGKYLKIRPSKNAKPVTFIDTMNYARLSVKNMGKLLGYNKLEYTENIGQLPCTSWEWDELVEYNIRDAEISKKFLKFIFESFVSLGGTVKKTIASSSKSLFQNKYLKDVFYRASKHHLSEMFNCFYGGRVEVIKRGYVQNMYYYDFNSLYPSVMHDEQFPDPNSMRITYNETDRYIRKYEGCSHVRVTVPRSEKYPLLPFRTEEGRVIFPVGTFKGWYTHIELRTCLEAGYIIDEVFKTYYFKNKIRPFKDFVSDMYKKRLEYKALDNPMQLVVKILMNSLFGKFGQKFEDRDNWVPFNHTVDELAKLPNFERIGDYLRIKEKTSEPESFCIPIWSAYVTAYGRIKLWRVMKETNPVYVDTDSVVTSQKIYTDNKLGNLKLEMFLKEAIFVRPKFYGYWGVEYKNGKVVDVEMSKIKGVSKKFNYLEFMGFLGSPKCTYQKFMRFKESIRRGFIPNEIQYITKNLSLDDTKRVWTKPFSMTELQSGTPIELKRQILPLAEFYLTSGT